MVRLLITWVAPDPTARGDILSAAAYLRSVRDRDVRVVLFGSSRLQSAVNSATWAGHAGLRPDQVVNLAVNSGGLWDALYMVSEAGGLPSSVQLVVIEIAHWDFNRNQRDPLSGMPSQIPQHFRGLASFSERLSVDGFASRARLLTDFIWPLYERRPLQQWRFQLPQPAVPSPPARLMTKEREEELARFEPFRGAGIAAMHFSDPAMSEFTVRNLDRLIARVRGSRRIVLLQLPTRREYLQTILNDPSRSAFYREVQKVVISRSQGAVSPLIWELPEDCGLTEAVFADYGHFTRDGAGAFTARLVDELVTTHVIARSTDAAEQSR